MVEVSSSNLLIPTKYLKGPNFTIGTFFVWNIRVMPKNSYLSHLLDHELLSFKVIVFSVVDLFA